MKVKKYLHRTEAEKLCLELMVQEILGEDSSSPRETLDFRERKNDFIQKLSNNHLAQELELYDESINEYKVFEDDEEISKDVDVLITVTLKMETRLEVPVDLDIESEKGKDELERLAWINYDLQGRKYQDDLVVEVIK